ncbi:hypothetical protein NSPZN2_60022 [Nitrospira defluvii]|uniref:Uncharacterized protein n=1 Tax=Nitrospira defluvii TaxID=330214 RepID=A0ABM8S6K1_9BACT|nr:hypothetical protein NSPZN2_60022 [Nitrospira defluvii]
MIEREVLYRLVMSGQGGTCGTLRWQLSE